MNYKNTIKSSFLAIPENESLARVVCAAFLSQLDPTVEELTDVKTAVSEAVTNSVVHGYSGRKDGVVFMDCYIDGEVFSVDIRDNGTGIEDIEKAMEPMYTSCPEAERSGMGFTVMETFMDTVSVNSVPGVGTKVSMTKRIRSRCL